MKLLGRLENRPGNRRDADVVRLVDPAAVGLRFEIVDIDADHDGTVLVETVRFYVSGREQIATARHFPRTLADYPRGVFID